MQVSIPIWKVRRSCASEGKDPEVRRARLKGEGRSCSTIRERDFPEARGEGARYEPLDRKGEGFLLAFFYWCLDVLENDGAFLLGFYGTDARSYLWFTCFEKEGADPIVVYNSIYNATLKTDPSSDKSVPILNWYEPSDLDGREGSDKGTLGFWGGKWICQ